MCGGSAPAPPDYSALAAASEYAADLAFLQAQDAMDWAKQQDASNRTTLDRVLGTVLPMQEETNRQAIEDRKYLIDTFRPLELQMVEEAKTYDTEARRGKEAGEAASEIAQQFNQTRKASEQRLQSYGIDPSQGAFAALQAGSAIDLASQQAGASRNARNRVEDVGRAIRADAVNLGRGLGSQIASSYTSSINAGNSATQGSANITNAGANAYGTGAQYMNAGVGAIGQGINALNTGYANQLAAFEADSQAQSGLMGGLGSLAGMAASYKFADGGAVAPAAVSPAAAMRQQILAKQAAARTWQPAPLPYDINGAAYRDATMQDRRMMAIKNWQVEQQNTQNQPHVPSFTNSAEARAQIMQRMAERNAPQPAQNLATRVVGRGGLFADGGAVGGLIRGAGSGISDSIHTTAPAGTYIVPKDVVDKVGVGNLDRAAAGTRTGTGTQVPVAVSAGEYALPPKATRRIGKENLDALVAAFHTPAAIQKQNRKGR